LQDRIRGDAYRTTVICVDSYHEGVMAGRFYNVGQEDEEISFQSLTQLLVGMEHQLNATNCPQSFTAVRSFAPAVETKLESITEVKRRRGLLGTFFVKVLFRQHTSWQGSVVWMEQHGEQPFRSVLELILLMDSALGGGQEERVS